MNRGRGSESGGSPENLAERSTGVEQYEEDLFEVRVDPGRIVSASLDAIDIALQIDEVVPEAKKILNRWREYILQNARVCADNPLDAKRLAISTAGILDVFVADNMKADSSGSLMEINAPYGRQTAEQAYKSLLESGTVEGKYHFEALVPVTRGEEKIVEDKLRAYFERIKNGMYRTEIFQSKERFMEAVRQNAAGNYYLETPLSVEELLEMKPDLEAASDTLGFLSVLKIRLNGSISAFSVYSNDIWPSGIATDLQQPSELHSVIPPQDRWLAFLENGCAPPLDHSLYIRNRPVLQKSSSTLERDMPPSSGDQPFEPEEFIKDVLSSEDLRRWQRYSLRKLALLAESGKPEVLREKLAKHEEHYRHFFSRPGEEPPQVFLTRGGFSANEAAINVIDRLSDPSQKKAFVLDGWYYENAGSLRDKFDPAWVVEEANILCVNTSPNGLISQELAERYPQERDRLIKAFVQNASAHSEEKYFLLVDKTTELLINPVDGIEIPDNLEIFETSSISKHQRGDPNYFFGSIEYRGKENHENLIREEIKSSRGELTPLAILNFPRLRRGEIRKNLEHLYELERNFVNAFNEAQSSLPPESRWAVQGNNGYWVILVPPFGALRKFAHNTKDLKKFTSETEYASSNEFTKLLNQHGFVRGGSFGFDEGRYSNIRVSINTDSHLPEDRKFALPRIAFGLKNTPEEVSRFGAEIAKILIQNLPSEMKTP